MRLAHYQHIESLLRSTPARVAVEVGVSWGQTSAHLLRAFPDLLLVMVDMWAGAYSAEFPRAIAATEFAAERRSVVRMPSVEAAGISPPADLVFIDAEHDEANVSADIRAWWPKVVSGGILCGHDYSHVYRGLRRVVDAWIKAHGLLLERSGRSIWWARKP